MSGKEGSNSIMNLYLRIVSFFLFVLIFQDVFLLLRMAKLMNFLSMFSSE